MSNQVSDSYRWMESASMSQPGTASKDDVIAGLRAELAAALEDKKRLDFIIGQSNDGTRDWLSESIWDDLIWDGDENAESPEESVRKTIDAAMKGITR